MAAVAAASAFMTAARAATTSLDTRVTMSDGVTLEATVSQLAETETEMAELREAVQAAEATSDTEFVDARGWRPD